MYDPFRIIHCRPIGMSNTYGKNTRETLAQNGREATEFYMQNEVRLITKKDTDGFHFNEYF